MQRVLLLQGCCFSRQALQLGTTRASRNSHLRDACGRGIALHAFLLEFHFCLWPYQKR